ncbi:MAG: hypothetical protein AAFY57_00425 [Cyanobacteria bacterium J06642_2]
MTARSNPSATPTSAAIPATPVLKSIGTRLLLSVLGGAAVGLGLLAVFTYSSLESRAKSEIRSSLKNEVSAVESKLTPIQQHARAMATAVSVFKKRGVSEQKAYEDLAFEYFLSQPDIGYGLGFGQTPNSLLSDRPWFFPYYYYDQDTEGQQGGRLPAPYNNVIYSEIAVDNGYNEEIYYTQPVETQQEVWLEPYGANGVLLMTYAAPVFDSGKNLIGITNVDIGVPQLVQQLEDGEGVVQGEGYFAVLSGEGNIITFPPEQPPAPGEGEPGSNYETNETLAAIWPKIEQAVGNTPEGLVAIPGSGNYWAYQTIPSTGWIMLAAVPVRTVLQPVVLTSVGATLLAAGILAAVVLLFVRNLNRRLNPILEECNKLVAADASTRSRLANQDEIGRLSTSFFNLLSQVDANERKIREEVERTKQAQHQLQQQAQQIESESEMLQEDVGYLLDVVSAAEEGDLTVKADVSERATGLVADTFNRLVEQLGNVMAEVNSSAQQTAGGAEELEQLAVSAAQQAQRQAKSLIEVETLMEGVTTLAGDTAQQARLTDESVQQARSAVVQGQAEMSSLAQSTDVLRQGTDQIVKRSQTLNNFVELAAQFAKDQKRTAALTRVLALNASMLAARAKGQSDPEQFASIANEFETVASQVNDLATSTNQGLMLLQQRTDQIQTVVSGLNQDVSDIDQQVQSITVGVGQSRQVFDNIQSATFQVEAAGQQTLDTSQSIAQSAQTTLQSVRGLSAIAADTSTRATMTRQRSGVMEQLSRNLLQNIEFFQLPARETSLTDDDTVVDTALPENGHRPAAVGQAADL